MKVQHQTFDEERTILIGMIVDKNVLARIASKWKSFMFASPYANKIGQWCVDYFQQYHKAPRSHIQSIYESWSSEGRPKEAAEIIGHFLDTLSNQYVRLARESNNGYVVDMAAKYFNKVRLNLLTERVSGDIIAGKTDKAIQRVLHYHKLEMGATETVDVLHNRNEIEAAFSEKHEAVITYTDGLGKFFGNFLERDGFIAFQGPEKRGKSFWLQEMAFRAVVQRRRVAFFECGDLSKHQIIRRFMARVARHPLTPCKVKYPTSIRLVQQSDSEPKVLIRYKRKVFTEPLTWRKAYKACRRLTENRQLKSVWRLSCHFNDTLTVDGIRNILDEWARNEWIPDVIVIDYADILNMDHLHLEGRDRIDHTWKQLRRLSQERHCLVVTATQAAARAYDTRTQSKSHFSEDKRKHAHVTGTVGINQLPIEKERGYMRLNWIDLREGWYSERRCCYVATCLPLANMAVRSIF